MTDNHIFYIIRKYLFIRHSLISVNCFSNINLKNRQPLLVGCLIIYKTENNVFQKLGYEKIYCEIYYFLKNWNFFKYTYKIIFIHITEINYHFKYKIYLHEIYN